MVPICLQPLFFYFGAFLPCPSQSTTGLALAARGVGVAVWDRQLGKNEEGGGTAVG